MVPSHEIPINALLIEAPAKLTISVIPARAGIQDALKNWIPGRAPLARNDDFLHFSRVLQEAQFIPLEPSEPAFKGFRWLLCTF
jgi:hypothetical protein